MSLSRFFKPIKKKKRPRSPEVIEIVDDDDEDEDIAAAATSKIEEKRHSPFINLLRGRETSEDEPRSLLVENEQMIENAGPNCDSVAAEKESSIPGDKKASCPPPVGNSPPGDSKSSSSPSAGSIAGDANELHLDMAGDLDVSVAAMASEPTCSATTSNAAAATAATVPTSAACSSSQNNPFAKFAFQQQGSTLPNLASFCAKSVEPPLKRKREVSSTASSDADGKKKKTEWVPMRDLPAREQERIVTKWHSFVTDSSSCSVEEARFHILVAARLHARCQEGPVRKAMQSLRQKLDDSLTVERLARTDPEDLHSSLSNLQYYRSKASQLVKAAREIQSQFAGKIPQEDSQLRQLTGIGPVFADLLAFVNTRKVHRARRGDSSRSANDVSSDPSL